MLLFLEMGPEEPVEVVHTIPDTGLYDLDASAEPDLASRTEVLGANGQVLHSSTTSGPGIVHEFLAAHENDYDLPAGTILTMFPELSRFSVHVPVLPGAESVRFQMRLDDGTYEDRGIWDLDMSDELAVPPGISEVEGHELVHSGGPYALNLAIIGDGYTEDELDLFAHNTEAIVAELLDAEPLASYADYINIYRVDAISQESGASYECEGCGPRENVFGSTFPMQELRDTFWPIFDVDPSGRAMLQKEQWKVAQAASVVPWDQIIVLVNSPKSSGFAVHFATVTNAAADFARIASHELGHSLGGLGDEYVAPSDPCILSEVVGLPANISLSPMSPPWSPWIDDGTPLPTEEDGGYGVGAYAGAYNCDEANRPEQSCRMRNHDDAFCSVCSEQLVRRLFRYVDPVDYLHIECEGETRTFSFVSPSPTSSDFEVFWFLNGEAEPSGSATLEEGFSAGFDDEVRIEIRHDTELVREAADVVLQRWDP
jgi:hypothetical protein